MRTGIKSLGIGLMFAGLLTLGVVWHNHSEAKREQAIQIQQGKAIKQEQEIEIQQREALTKILAERGKEREFIARMVSAHNAVTNWADAFSGVKFDEMFASQELEQVLVRKDGRPVLVFGSIVDVITENDGCKLEVDAKANLVSNIRLWLRCTPAQVKEALSPEKRHTRKPSKKSEKM
jgi:hypothetical protein